MEAQTATNLALHYGRFYNFLPPSSAKLKLYTYSVTNGGVSGAFVKCQWGLLRRWANAGSFLMVSSGKSPAYCSQSSQTSSKHSLLRAARASLSFRSSRKQSVVSRGTGGLGFSKESLFKNRAPKMPDGSYASEIGNGRHVGKIAFQRVEMGRFDCTIH
jgi:hypothetical protein